MSSHRSVGQGPELCGSRRREARGGRRITDWDDAYANSAHIAGGDRWPEAWVAPARDYRARLANDSRAQLDMAYGPHPRHRFDLFMPRRTPAGLIVVVHGGYWLALDKSYASHFAAGGVGAGYAVAVPSYRLCPEASITDIAIDVAAAVEAAGAMVAGPILLAGHSAGGQIVTRLATGTSALSSAARRRLTRVTSISGLHDLAPLLRTTMNATLRLTKDDVARESPCRLAPLPGVHITAWVGSDERPEFLRQSRLLADAWPSADLVIDPRRHHFDVVDALSARGSALVAAVIGT